MRGLSTKLLSSVRGPKELQRLGCDSFLSGFVMGLGIDGIFENYDFLI